MNKPKVAIRKVEAYYLPEIRAAVEDFITSAGPGRLQTAKTVLLKPNLLGDFPPERAVTTHPIVLEAIIQYLLDLGKEVWLGDSPGGSGNIRQIWQSTGMQALADKYPIKLVNFSSFGIQDFELYGIRLSLSKVLWAADVIISVSKLKTHSLMAYTGAVKNLYGLVPGMIKTEYHKQYPSSNEFGHMLAVLYKLVRHRICYHLMDGIIGMDGAGPSAGKPRNFGLLMGSTSAPALDYLASSFMGFSLNQVGYVKEALHEEGVIPSQIDYPLSFNDFNLGKVNYRAAAISSGLLRHVPRTGRLLMQKVMKFHPVITDKCRSCQLCVKSCPVQTIIQGEQGRPFIKTDKCIRCLCCHELCPYQAIRLHKSGFARLVMR